MVEAITQTIKHKTAIHQGLCLVLYSVQYMFYKILPHLCLIFTGNAIASKLIFKWILTFYGSWNCVSITELRVLHFWWNWDLHRTTLSEVLVKSCMNNQTICSKRLQYEGKLIFTMLNRSWSERYKQETIARFVQITEHILEQISVPNNANKK